MGRAEKTIVRLTRIRPGTEAGRPRLLLATQSSMFVRVGEANQFGWRWNDSTPIDLMAACGILSICYSLVPAQRTPVLSPYVEFEKALEGDRPGNCQNTEMIA